jgi:hypothetical protein
MAASPVPPMAMPILFHMKLTSGVPLARHVNVAVAPLSEADLEMEGESSSAGAAAQNTYMSILNIN